MLAAGGVLPIASRCSWSLIRSSEASGRLVKILMRFSSALNVSRNATHLSVSDPSTAFQESERNRVHGALGMTTGTEALELAPPPLIDQGLRDDAARGISGAQKQDVVGPLLHRVV